MEKLRKNNQTIRTLLICAKWFSTEKRQKITTVRGKSLLKIYTLNHEYFQAFGKVSDHL